MVDTPVNLVETPIDLVKPLVRVRLKLAETLVDLAETLIDPLLHPIQGRKRYCCQSNAYGEDANKNRKDAGKLSHGNRECNTRSAPAIQPRR